MKRDLRNALKRRRDDAIAERFFARTAERVSRKQPMQRRRAHLVLEDDNELEQALWAMPSHRFALRRMLL